MDDLYSNLESRDGVVLYYLVEIDEMFAVEQGEGLYENLVFNLVFESKLRVGVDDLYSNLESRDGVVLNCLVEIDEMFAVEKGEELYENLVFNLVFVSKLRVGVDDLI